MRRNIQKKLFISSWPLLFILLALVSRNDIVYAQSSLSTVPSGQETKAKDSVQIVFGSADTLIHFSFQPIVIEGEYPFKDKQLERKYRNLYLDIKRTYPLAKIVSSEVMMVNAQLDSVYTTKSKQKAYMKWYEKHIYRTYIDTLKALDIRQVKLFIKLVDRETGSTPFDLIKKYRGGLDAFMWQLSANVLLLNLKKDYDPVEDAMIDDIIMKLY